MIRIGGKDLSNIMFGNKEVVEVYQGSNLIWQGGDKIPFVKVDELVYGFGFYTVIKSAKPNTKYLVIFDIDKSELIERFSSNVLYYDKIIENGYFKYTITIGSEQADLVLTNASFGPMTIKRIYIEELK